MDHHWIKENFQRDFCPYCKRKVNGDRWKSEFFNDTHYKVISCRNCSRELRIPVDFLGDGNDSWDGNDGLTDVEYETGSLEVRIKDSEPKFVKLE